MSNGPTKDVFFLKVLILNICRQGVIFLVVVIFIVTTVLNSRYCIYVQGHMTRYCCFIHISLEAFLAHSTQFQTIQFQVSAVF
jgi:hypothetical protein